MRSLRLGVGLTVAALAGLFPSAALAQPVVPPGNSAINQYKETLPGPGGDQPTDSGGNRSPAQALGAENATRLERLGPVGRAAAALAAKTAPAGGGSRKKSGAATAAQPGGSSGLSEVLGQATGSSSSGEMGLLLPLVIVAAILGAVVYAIARRRDARSS